MVEEGLASTFWRLSGGEEGLAGGLVCRGMSYRMPMKADDWVKGMVL